MSFRDHILTKTRLLSAPLRPWVHFTALGPFHCPGHSVDQPLRFRITDQPHPRSVSWGDRLVNCQGNEVGSGPPRYGHL